MILYNCGVKIVDFGNVIRKINIVMEDAFFLYPNLLLFNRKK